MIDSFSGKYRFLSNFYPCTIWIEGYCVSYVEVAFQAQKTLNTLQRMAIINLNSPKVAKNLGRHCSLRGDWEQIKYLVMFDLVRQKFFNDYGLARKLLATEDAQLIEGNTWGDTYWGICNGVGKNQLGNILMLVREEIKVFIGELKC